MRETKNSLKPDRAGDFDSYFNDIYKERWEKLRAGLEREPRHEKLTNPFGLQDYSLDFASTLPPRALAPERGDLVADFCASPGGKSLAMIFALAGDAQFVCNDLSPARVARLKAIFHDCLPLNVRANVKIYKSDASRWGRQRPETFDRVLVDAPCSGERHMIQAPAELARWSLKGAQRLAIRQNALLCSALDSLRSGGRVVYSTCSINPLENDGVVKKLMKSRRDRFRVLPFTAEIGEPTAHGWIVLPDVSDCGPIYLSLLEKI